MRAEGDGAMGGYVDPISQQILFRQLPVNVPACV